MKFAVEKEKLAEIVQKVLNVVPVRSTLPVLSNFLLETNEKQVSLKATDLDVSMTANVEAEVSKKGALAVPARPFADLVRELPSGKIDVSSTEDRLDIKCKGGRYKISGIPAEDFPALPEVYISKAVKLDGERLVRMIRKSLFAVSKDETRPALNGVLWHAEADKLLMVATDGHRLAKIEHAKTKIKRLTNDIIVPPKALDYFVRIFADYEGNIGVIFGESNLSFDFGDALLTTRLLEGPYPNYDQVIPKENVNKLVVARDDFGQTVRRVAILSNALTHQIKLSLKGTSMELMATNFDIGGEARETLPANYSGKEMDIGYNASYLLDVVKQVDSDELIFELDTPTTAGVARPNRYEENEEYMFLLMPLRLMD